MNFNDTYLDRTPNKHDRDTTSFVPLGVVWHETAGYGSLEWNLRPDVRSSFNYLIKRSGACYHYVDETRYVAWHAGVQSSWWIGGVRYVGAQLNKYFIGVELEGPNDGTPITAAQVRTAIALLQYFNTRYRIPLLDVYHPEHAEVAPGYKTDGRGFDADMLVLNARPPLPTTIEDATVIGISAQSCTLDQFGRSLARHAVPWSDGEVARAYRFAQDWQIDAGFGLAVWHHEGNFGQSPLQRLSNNPFNIKAVPGDWRPTITYNRALWEAYESPLLGWHAGILHLKRVYGAQGLHTVRQIIPVFAPGSDGNAPQRYGDEVLVDMAYIARN